MTFLNWLMANLDTLFVVLFAIHGVAVLIVNLTPTPKDDAVVAKAYTVIEVLAGLFTKQSKL